MHLTDEQIQRLVDGQPRDPGGLSLERHLASCGECQERHAVNVSLAEEISRRLRVLDHPVPLVSAEEVKRLARHGRPGFGRWAAAFLLCVGLAGVAYATPGSPLPGWVEAISTWIGSESKPPTSPEAEPSAPLPERAGIAVLPGEQFAILFRPGGTGGSVRVSLTDAREIVVRAGSGEAGFTAGVGQLVILGRSDTTSFEVQIPRSAPRVEILVGGHRVFLKAADQITSPARPDPDGSYLLDLSD